YQQLTRGMQRDDRHLILPVNGGESLCGHEPFGSSPNGVVILRVCSHQRNRVGSVRIDNDIAGPRDVWMCLQYVHPDQLACLWLLMTECLPGSQLFFAA